MLIRKITEYSGACKTEKILLLCDAEDQGWEMTLEELDTLRTLIEKVLHIPNLRDRIKDLEGEIKERGRVLDQTNERYLLVKEDKRILLDKVMLLEKELSNYTLKSEDHAAECPDFIEPLEIPESQETLVITEVPIIEEKYTEVPGIVPEIEEKVQKTAENIYSSYIQMVIDEVSAKEIQLKMSEELGISWSTATNYYYTKVKPEATRQIKDLVLELEKRADLKQPKIQRKDDATNKEKALMQEIAALKEFKSPDDFLTYAIVYEIGTDKKGKELKEIYLKTHPGTKWQ